MKAKHLLSTTAFALVLGTGTLCAQDRGYSSDPNRERPATQSNRPIRDVTPNRAQTNSPSKDNPSTNNAPPDRAQANDNNTRATTGQNNSPSNDRSQSPPSNAAQNRDQPASNKPASNTAQNPQGSGQPASKAPQNRPAADNNRPSTNQTPAPSAAQQQPDQRTNQAVQQPRNQQAQPHERLSASLQTSQKTRLSQAVASVNVRPITNVNFSIAVGTAIPASVTLHPVPSTIVEVIPEYRGYDFFLVRNEIVIVEPGSHRIVDVIERGGSASRASTRTTTDRKIQLSGQQREIIRKQRRVTTTGSSASRTRVQVGDVLPESVEIQSFPEEVYREVPTVRTYRYIQSDDNIYIVDPGERRVIEEIE